MGWGGGAGAGAGGLAIKSFCAHLALPEERRVSEREPEKRNSVRLNERRGPGKVAFAARLLRDLGVKAAVVGG